MYNPFVNNANYHLSSTWSQHINAGYQGGTDYHTSSVSGRPVPSAVAGTVLSISLDSAGNSVIKVRETGSNVVSVYMHMRSFSVAANDQVIAGQIIGESGGAAGDYGKGQSGGAHIHWHLEINGVRSDAIGFLDNNQSSPGAQEGDPMWYIRNSVTGVIAVAGVGGKGYHLFATTAEYDLWVQTVPYINSNGFASPKLPLPPADGSTIFTCAPNMFDNALAIASGT